MKTILTMAISVLLGLALFAPENSYAGSWAYLCKVKYVPNRDTGNSKGYSRIEVILNSGPMCGTTNKGGTNLGLYFIYGTGYPNGYLTLYEMPELISLYEQLAGALYQQTTVEYTLNNYHVAAINEVSISPYY